MPDSVSNGKFTRVDSNIIALPVFIYIFFYRNLILPTKTHKKRSIPLDTADRILRVHAFW